VLKPFDDARLREAFDHARLVMMDRRHGELGRRLAEVLRHWERAAQAANGDAADAPAGDGEAADALDQAAALVGPRESNLITRFSVRSDGRVKFIPAAAVDWIEADRNYIVLCVGDAKHKVRGSLRDVITRLDRRTFARIHKSAIVNIDRIRELQPWFGGDYIAILRNGAKLKVSRRHVAALIRPMA
jgi:two-component system LytT family response regulator